MAQTETTAATIDVQKEKIEELQTVIINLSKILNSTLEETAKDNTPQMKELSAILHEISEDKNLIESLELVKDQLTIIQKPAEINLELSISKDELAQLEAINLDEVKQEMETLVTAFEKSNLIQDLLKTLENSQLSKELRKEIIVKKD
jgi:hypothetical protein